MQPEDSNWQCRPGGDCPVCNELALDKLSVRTPVQCKKGSNQHGILCSS